MYLHDTGRLISFPGLTSRDDLRGIESLTVVIDGPFPEWTQHEHLPGPFHAPAHLKLQDELCMHFTGTYHALLTVRKWSQLLPSARFAPPMLRNARQLLNKVYRTAKIDIFYFDKITISWNHTKKKEQIPFSVEKHGFTVERKREVRKLLRKDEKIPKIKSRIIWPTMQEAISEDMKAGSVTFTLGSQCWDELMRALMGFDAGWPRMHSMMLWLELTDLGEEMHAFQT